MSNNKLSKKRYENHENQWGIMVYDTKTGEKLSGNRIAQLLNGYHDVIMELRNIIRKIKEG